jgi:hypothetical protein
MRRIVWSTLAIIIGVILFAAGCFVGSYSNDFTLAGGPCEDEVKAQYFSPDKSMVALVIVQNCGATSDYATSVEYRSVGENARSRDDYLFSVKGLNNIEVVWATEKVWDPNWSAWASPFTIVYDRPKRVNRQAIIWSGQKISYRERE